MGCRRPIAVFCVVFTGVVREQTVGADPSDGRHLNGGTPRRWRVPFKNKPRIGMYLDTCVDMCVGTCTNVYIGASKCDVAAVGTAAAAMVDLRLSAVERTELVCELGRLGRRDRNVCNMCIEVCRHVYGHVYRGLQTCVWTCV